MQRRSSGVKSTCAKSLFSISLNPLKLGQLLQNASLAFYYLNKDFSLLPSSSTFTILPPSLLLVLQRSGRNGDEMRAGSHDAAFISPLQGCCIREKPQQVAAVVQQNRAMIRVWGWGGGSFDTESKISNNLDYLASQEERSGSSLLKVTFPPQCCSFVYKCHKFKQHI